MNLQLMTYGRRRHCSDAAMTFQSQRDSFSPLLFITQLEAILCDLYTAPEMMIEQLNVIEYACDVKSVDPH